MKQMVLGFIGLLISVYVISICLNIFSIQIHKNQLEHTVSRAVQNGLEEFYHTEKKEEAEQQIINEIFSISKNDEIMIEIVELDLDKGVLQVKATEKLKLITGGEKQLVCIKTAIMERQIVEYPRVTVTFLVDGMLYKQVEVQQGEKCPMPRPPYESFLGWIDESSGNCVSEIGTVCEDKIYIGIGS